MSADAGSYPGHGSCELIRALDIGIHSPFLTVTQGAVVSTLMKVTITGLEAMIDASCTTRPLPLASVP